MYVPGGSGLQDAFPYTGERCRALDQSVHLMGAVQMGNDKVFRLTQEFTGDGTGGLSGVDQPNVILGPFLGDPGVDARGFCVLGREVVMGLFGVDLYVVLTQSVPGEEFLLMPEDLGADLVGQVADQAGRSVGQIQDYGLGLVQERGDLGEDISCVLVVEPTATAENLDAGTVSVGEEEVKQVQVVGVQECLSAGGFQVLTLGILLAVEVKGTEFPFQLCQRFGLGLCSLVNFFPKDLGETGVEDGATDLGRDLLQLSLVDRESRLVQGGPEHLYPAYAPGLFASSGKAFEFFQTGDGGSQECADIRGLAVCENLGEDGHGLTGAQVEVALEHPGVGAGFRGDGVDDALRGEAAVQAGSVLRIVVGVLAVGIDDQLAQILCSQIAPEHGGGDHLHGIGLSGSGLAEKGGSPAGDVCQIEIHRRVKLVRAEEFRGPVGTNGAVVLEGNEGGTVLGILCGPVDSCEGFFAVLPVDDQRQKVPGGIDPVFAGCRKGDQVPGEEDAVFQLVVSTEHVTAEAGPGHVCNGQLIQRGHGPFPQFVHGHVLQGTEGRAYGFLNPKQDCVAGFGNRQEECAPGKGAGNSLQGGIRGDGKAVVVGFQDVAYQEVSGYDLVLFQFALPVAEAGQSAHSATASPKFSRRVYLCRTSLPRITAGSLLGGMPGAAESFQRALFMDSWRGWR